MGTQQHRSLTRCLCLLPHLEEQLGAGLVSLAAVRGAAGMEGHIWGAKCVPLIGLVCPLCSSWGSHPSVCVHRHHWRPLCPQTHPGPCPTWTCPSAPTLPGQHTQPAVLEHGPQGTLLSPPGLSWAVAVESEVGSREGLWHRSVLCPSEQVPLAQTVPPSRSQGPPPRSCRALVWAGALGNLLSPLGVPSSCFAEWFWCGGQAPKGAVP